MKSRILAIGIVVFSALFLFGCAHNSVRQDSQEPLMTAAVSVQNTETESHQVAQTQPDTAKETETKLSDEKKDVTGEGEEEESPQIADPFYLWNKGEEEESPQIADPFYLWNKGWYYFNDKFYFWLLKPFSQVYSAIFPEIARIGVSNFFYNITTPIRFVNSVLQFKMKDAGNELIRLAINSTLGVGGLGDFAKGQLDIKRKNEDLGQTFGTYGIGHGFYLVWPLLGPSSLRDSVGLVGDGFLNPINYVRPVEASLGITAYDTVNHTSLHIGDYEDIIKAAIDPYVSIRDAYVQNRKKKVDE